MLCISSDVMSGGCLFAAHSTGSTRSMRLRIKPRAKDWIRRRRTVSVTVEERLLRGDIWLVDFGADPQDPEQAFERPATIVSENRLHHPNLRMVIVVPGTSVIRGIPLHVVCSPDHDNGLTAKTAFQVEQVRAVATVRLVERLGRLDALSLHAMDEILRNALCL